MVYQKKKFKINGRERAYFLISQIMLSSCGFDSRRERLKKQLEE